MYSFKVGVEKVGVETCDTDDEMIASLLENLRHFTRIRLGVPAETFDDMLQKSFFVAAEKTTPSLHLFIHYFVFESTTSFYNFFIRWKVYVSRSLPYQLCMLEGRREYMKFAKIPNHPYSPTYSYSISDLQQNLAIHVPEPYLRRARKKNQEEEERRRRNPRLVYCSKCHEPLISAATLKAYTFLCVVCAYGQLDVAGITQWGPVS